MKFPAQMRAIFRQAPSEREQQARGILFCFFRLLFSLILEEGKGPLEKTHVAYFGSKSKGISPAQRYHMGQVYALGTAIRTS